MLVVGVVDIEAFTHELFVGAIEILEITEIVIITHVVGDSLDIVFFVDRVATRAWQAAALLLTLAIILTTVSAEGARGSLRNPRQHATQHDLLTALISSVGTAMLAGLASQARLPSAAVRGPVARAATLIAVISYRESLIRRFHERDMLIVSS